SHPKITTSKRRQQSAAQPAQGSIAATLTRLHLDTDYCHSYNCLISNCPTPEMTMPALQDPDLFTERSVSKYRQFGQELDEIRRRVEAEIGDEDVRHLNKVERF